MSKRPTLQDLNAGQLLDWQMIKLYGRGESLARFPLYHAPAIPTYKGALILAQMHEIETVSENVKASVSTSGTPIWTAVVCVRRDNTSRCGAGISQDYDCAIGYAFRNAVRQILTIDKIVSLKESKGKRI